MRLTNNPFSQLCSWLTKTPFHSAGTGVSCDTANWWGSLDKKGWSVCPKTNTYLKGFWRNDPSGGNGVWLLEEGKCCAASEPSYTNQPATCRNENWWSTLDGWVVR